MLIWGSISLAQYLIREGLIDEYRLVICPVVLGSSGLLFDNVASINVTLRNAKILDRRAVLLS